jgi:hypothetical protein
MTLVIFQSSLQRIFKVLFNSPRWHLRRQVEVYSSLTSGSAFRTVRLKPVFTIANSGRAARSENDDLRSVQADLSQAVDLSVEPVRAIARNSLAGSRRWDAPRDAPHSRVLERFANFASLFRCDAALREIVHDLIDVPLDGAGRIWLFFVGHRASSSPSSVDSSHPAPAVRSSTRFSGPTASTLGDLPRHFVEEASPLDQRQGCAPMPRLASVSYRLPVRSCDRCLHHNLDMVLTGPTCTQISPSLFRPSPAAASRPARALPARTRRPRWRRLW